MRPHKLDKEEEKFLRSYEKGEWKSSQLTKAERHRYAAAAAAALKKDQRINIRLSQADLEGIQARAAQEGIPYQTLIASVLHKYILGRLA
jgi:predicted DNA binding CopG/RHH family protein